METQIRSAPVVSEKVASLTKNTVIICEFFTLPKKPGMIFINDHEKSLYAIFEIIPAGDGYQLNTSIGQSDGENTKRAQQLVGNNRKKGIDFMVKAILEEFLPADRNYEKNLDKLREILHRAIENSFAIH